MDYCDTAPCWLGVPVGDWATWATALFTLGALIAALFAAFKTAGMLRVEQQRDRKRDAKDDEQRRVAEQAMQADYVAAWHVRLDPLRWAARVINNSPLPIWDVTVEFIGPDGTVRDPVTVPVIPPGTEDVVWPWELRRAADRDQNGEPIYAESPSEFGVRVAFRDVAGRTWSRNEHGILERTGAVAFPRAAGAIAGGYPVQVHTADRPPSESAP